MGPQFLATNANPNFYHSTSVNLHDPEFSPYQSYSVNHQLRDALLSKDPNRVFLNGELWRAVGLDKEIITPLIVALLDGASVTTPPARARLHSSGWKADSKKLQKLIDGESGEWQLEVSDEVLNGMPVSRCHFTGQVFDPKKPVTPGQMPSKTPVEASYWIASFGSNTVCAQATVTNSEYGTFFFSRREGFDARGYPTNWVSIEMTNGIQARRMDIALKEIQVPAEFDDVEVFSPKFSADYTVSDVTSPGQNIAIQRVPRPSPTKVEQPMSLSRRIGLFSLLVLPLLPLSAILFAVLKGRKKV